MGNRSSTKHDQECGPTAHGEKASGRIAAASGAQRRGRGGLSSFMWMLITSVKVPVEHLSAARFWPSRFAWENYAGPGRRRHSDGTFYKTAFVGGRHGQRCN